MEANFCRRCGKSLVHEKNHIYTCADGHVIFNNATPATTLILINGKREALFSVRATDPGKGKLDFPGGFCEGAETFEDSLAREIKEEIGLSVTDYETPKYLMTVLDDYEYKGEVIPVLTGVFWAKIKPTARIMPKDDVAEAIFYSYDSVDRATVQWPPQIAALESLRTQGIL